MGRRKKSVEPGVIEEEVAESLTRTDVESGDPVFGDEVYNPEVTSDASGVIDPEEIVPIRVAMRSQLYDTNCEGDSQEVQYETYEDLNTAYNEKYWIEYTDLPRGYPYTGKITVHQTITDNRMIDIFTYGSLESFQGQLTMLLGIYGFNIVRIVT